MSSYFILDKSPTPEDRMVHTENLPSVISKDVELEVAATKLLNEHGLDANGNPIPESPEDKRENTMKNNFNKLLVFCKNPEQMYFAQRRYRYGNRPRRCA